MFYMLLGQDNFSLSRSLDEIKAGICDRALLSANTTVLDGQKLTVEQLRTVCKAAPFLAEKRLVIVRGLLERFETGNSHRRRERISHPDSQQKEYKYFTACVREIPESTVLVLLGGAIKGNNSLLRELSAEAEVRSFPLLRGARLRQWIQRRVKEIGSSISPHAVDLMAKLVGSDLWTMANEIDKLALFTSGRCIEEEDVRALASSAQQTSVFAMIDAILESKAGLAERLIQVLLQRGITPAYLMVMLSRQVRMMIRTSELMSQRKSKIEIQRALGLTSEFALGKTLEQARRYPLERIIKVYHKLLDADLAIKTGRYEPELTLNILAAELCQQN